MQLFCRTIGQELIGKELAEVRIVLSPIEFHQLEQELDLLAFFRRRGPRKPSARECPIEDETVHRRGAGCRVRDRDRAAAGDANKVVLLETYRLNHRFHILDQVLE